MRRARPVRKRTSGCSPADARIPHQTRRAGARRGAQGPAGAGGGGGHRRAYIPTQTHTRSCTGNHRRRRRTRGRDQRRAPSGNHRYPAHGAVYTLPCRRDVWSLGLTGGPRSKHSWNVLCAWERYSKALNLWLGLFVRSRVAGDSITVRAPLKPPSAQSPSRHRSRASSIFHYRPVYGRAS